MNKINRKYSVIPEYRWIGVDLDETLAIYNGGLNLLKIGEPIPKMINRVKEWLKKGITVRIVTARVGSTTLKLCGFKKEEVVKAIQDWTEIHIGQRLDVTCEKDAGLLELWDDRAIQVIPNTGERI
jgi:hypothetical protein